MGFDVSAVFGRTLDLVSFLWIVARIENADRMAEML